MLRSSFVRDCSNLQNKKCYNYQASHDRHNHGFLLFEESYLPQFSLNVFCELFKPDSQAFIDVFMFKAKDDIGFYEIASIFYNSIEKEFVMGGAALTFGSVCVAHGFALTKLKNLVGSVAYYAGVFEIISGCFLITVVFSFVGFVLLLPVELFQIITLYKVVELIQAKQKEPNMYNTSNNN